MRYEPTAEWAGFYEELEPAQRARLLHENLERVPDDGVNEYRKALFLERFRDPKHPNREVDNYMWHYMFLLEAYRNRRALFSGFSRDVKRAAAALHWDELDALAEDRQAALYLEWRNAASRYLDACRSDQYGRTLFGLKRASDAEKVEHATLDVWRMSRGVAEASGRGERLRLFCDALHDALLLFDPKAADGWDALEANGDK